MKTSKWMAVSGLLVAGLLLLGATKTTPAKDDQAAVGPKTPEDYMTLVSTFVDIGQLDNAEETAREGMKKFPKSAGFHFMLGYVEFARRNWADAWYLLEYEKLKVGASRDLGAQCAILSNRIVENERGPDVDEVRRVMRALADKNDPKKQLAELEAVAKFRGTRPVLTLWIAEAKARNADVNGAAALFKQIIDQDPMFVPAYVNLANLRAKQGNKKESQSLIARAKQIDSTHWALPNTH